MSGSKVYCDRNTTSKPGLSFSGTVGKKPSGNIIEGASSFSSVRYTVTLTLSVNGSGNPPSYTSTTKNTNSRTSKSNLELTKISPENLSTSKEPAASKSLTIL